MPNTFRVDNSTVHIPAGEERPRKINVGFGEITVTDAAPEPDDRKSKTVKSGNSLEIDRGVFVHTAGIAELTVEDIRGVTELRSSYAPEGAPTKKAPAKKKKSSAKKSKKS